MSRQLPPRPSLEHLKKQAKELLASVRSGEPEALGLYRSSFPGAEPPTLARAQLVLARDYGYESWSALKRYLADNELADFVAALLEGRLEEAKKLLPNLRDAIPGDLVASALTGQVEVVMDAVRKNRALLNDPVGRLERPLLTYVCFSRLVADPEFGPGIRQLCKELLEAGADPNVCYLSDWAGEKWRATPLYGAAGVLNDAGLTKLLLDAGADPNDGSGDEDPYRGESLYHVSEHTGHNECLRLLLDAGPSQVAKNYCIKRKLDFEDMEGVRLYLDHGADPNANFRRTALSHAILRNRSLDMLRLLLSYGADPNAKDMDGTTAYGLARRLGNKEAARLLEEHGARADFEPHDAILIAAAEEDEPKVRELATEHPEVVAAFGSLGRQENGGLPLGSAGDVLHDMARLGHVKALRVLLDLGIDPGLRNGFNETPLHWACVAGRAEAAKLLIDRGAPLDVREKNHGADPLGWAIWGSTYWNDPHGDYVLTVKVMLEAGAPRPEQPGGSAEVKALLSERGP